MATIAPAQIAQYASQAGFTGNALTTAVAIAMAESGGNTTASHLNTNATVDYGLWQINSVHTQYNASLLLNNPLYNAQAAYQLSKGGSNWTPWTTFNTGAYLRYMPQAAGNVAGSTGNPAPNVPTSIKVSQIPNTTGKAFWWTFPRVDNMGAPDPFGGFPKPDSNIQVPAGYPIVALLPGTVTQADAQDSWGASVTLKLDQPLNALADHTSYIHLRSDLQVRPGQHVAAGQLIAYNGSSQAAGAQKVPLGFALYHGDAYGRGSSWQYETYANVTGLLNPVPLLNAAKAGTLVINNPGALSGPFNLPIGASASLSIFSMLGFGQAPTYTPLSEQIHQTLIHFPGFYGIALALDEAEQFPGWIDLVNPSETPLPDISGIARSIGATISDNAIPFLIRSGTALLGFALMFALIVKPLFSNPVTELAGSFT